MSRSEILVIDDDPEIRSNLRDLLELHGYGVTVAENGLEGLAAALEHSPDLIVCDVMMPEMDGIEVVRRLRTVEVGLCPPVIFLTGLDDEASVSTGLSSGADDYLIKPFMAPKLLRTIEARLRRQEQMTRFHDSRAGNMARQFGDLLPSDVLEPLEAVEKCAAAMRSAVKPLAPAAVTTMGRQIARLVWRTRKRLENYALVLEPASSNHNLGVLTDHPLHPSLASAVVTETATEIASLADRSSDLRLEVQGMHTRIPAWALRKAVLELADNAFSFSSPRETVKIHWDTKAGSRLVVTDQGPGLPEPWSHAKCLDEWRRFQLQRNLSGQPMGLAACAYLLETYGSSLHFRELNPGLEVSFDLVPGDPGSPA